MAKTFGESLREIRLGRGLTLEKMAEQLGTTKAVLSRYENDQRQPKITTVASFAQRLGVHISVLSGGNIEDDQKWELANEGITDTAEQDLLLGYRNLSEDKQLQIRQYIQFLASTK